MAYRILDLRDAHGKKYQQKFLIDGDGTTLIPSFNMEGAAANLNLDLDTSTPIPVAEGGGALTALQALAALIVSARLNVRAVLDAGSAAFGKLAANSGVVIGAVEIAASQVIQLAAGTNAFGKLAANTTQVLIGMVELATGQSVAIANAATPYVDTISSANTTANNLPSQAVKGGTVMIRARKTLTGTLTIKDGTRATGVVMQCGDVLFVHATNLSQISYQFSVNASSTEQFEVSAGV